MPMPERHPFVRSPYRTLLSLSFALLCGIAAGCETVPDNRVQTGKLTAFETDAQLRRVLRRWVAEPPRPAPPPSGAQSKSGNTIKPGTEPKWNGPSGDDIPETIIITASLIRGTAAVGVPVSSLATQDAAQSITNTQEAGVDEGDIVKLHGSTLVILRRGRLFTVSIAGGRMQPIDSINAYPPGVDASADWYDEMLLSGDRIVVVGYSYGRGGTEINRFRIDRTGHLSFEDAYQLNSNDYYSSRNYASRLVGNRLVFYTPSYLPYQARDPLEDFPSLRRWNGTGPAPRFRRFARARNVYIPSGLLDAPGMIVSSLHTVTNCDLLAPTLTCTATSVLGAEGHSYYVSENAVYVWTTASFRERSRSNDVEPALLYRLPLDGSAPSAIGTFGAPTDQFSFREDTSDQTLNVLVRALGTGEAFWSSEHAMGAVALLRIPLSSFGDGSIEAEWSWYRPLPAPPSDGFSFQNRFVGDYVLYGSGTAYFSGQEPFDPVLVAANIRDETVSQFLLGHAVDRIELLGKDAVVIGSDDTSLHFSTVDLTSHPFPGMGDVYTYRDASQAETRSHAFFFKADPISERSAREHGTPGVLGLPVARPARATYHQLFEDSAAMVFLRRADRKFRLLGDLPANDERVVDDDCVSSCVDWYGNARPIFILNRVFALLGYEIVEGALNETAIREVGRVSFAPAALSGRATARP